MVTLWRENGHVTELSLMEGEWSCYRGGQFNGGRMVMLQRWSLMEGEWSCYRMDERCFRPLLCMLRLNWDGDNLG